MELLSRFLEFETRMVIMAFIIRSNYVSTRPLGCFQYGTVGLRKVKGSQRRAQVAWKIAGETWKYAKEPREVLKLYRCCYSETSEACPITIRVYLKRVRKRGTLPSHVFPPILFFTSFSLQPPLAIFISVSKRQESENTFLYSLISS